MTSHNSTNISSLCLLNDCSFSHIFLTFTVKRSINLLQYCLFVTSTFKPCNAFGLVWVLWVFLTKKKLFFLLVWALDVLPGQKKLQTIKKTHNFLSCEYFLYIILLSLHSILVFYFSLSLPLSSFKLPIAMIL